METTFSTALQNGWELGQMQKLLIEKKSYKNAQLYNYNIIIP